MITLDNSERIYRAFCLLAEEPREHGTDFRALYLACRVGGDWVLQDMRNSLMLSAQPTADGMAGINAWVSPRGQVYSVGYGRHGDFASAVRVRQFALEEAGFLHVSHSRCQVLYRLTPRQAEFVAAHGIGEEEGFGGMRAGRMPVPLSGHAAVLDSVPRGPSWDWHHPRYWPHMDTPYPDLTTRAASAAPSGLQAQF